MTISGFTVCRNAEQLYYPVKESILSALPIVDEFVAVVGRGHRSDRTLELLRSIESPKLKIIETDWDTDKFPNGTVHAQQTDVAKSHCTGDWLLYLQADEVLHENAEKVIRAACERWFNDSRVEGMLLDYHHFWGDYQHVIDSHGWYKREIRVIRNHPDIHSYQSAQSFRVIEDFDGLSYRQKEGTRKLRVAKIDAAVYHYGWVRPPQTMALKMKELDAIHSHQQAAYPQEFDYGDLSRLASFKGSHPQVMHERMASMHWSDCLRHDHEPVVGRNKVKHERWKYRFMSWVERSLLNGRELGTYKNYQLIHE